MKTSLYEEIVAAMREGNSKEDITALINEAAAQVKEEKDASKAALDEARANYIDALYNFQNALGVKTTKEQATEIASFMEQVANIDNFFPQPTKKNKDDMNMILDFVKNL